MGKAFTKVKSPLRDYNLESRVHKVLESTPIPAPRHPVPDRFRETIEQQKQHLNGNVSAAAAAASANQPTQAEMIRKMALEATDEELNDSTPEILRKNDNLLDRMDQLKIVSEGTNPDIKTASSRRMPEERGKNQLETIYGHVEPDRIPIGRMSMQQVCYTCMFFPYYVSNILVGGIPLPLLSPCNFVSPAMTANSFVQFVICLVIQN